MRLYEYEGKQILASQGISIPSGAVLRSPDDIANHTIALPCVIKAQVLFGNRKEKGLIEFAHTTQELVDKVNKMLSLSASVLVESLLTFSEELYVAIRYDTKTRQPVFIYTQHGGSGIETRGVSLNSIQIDPLAQKLVLPNNPLPLPFSNKFVTQLIKAFFSSDATLIEINPLVTINGVPTALDAKVELDNAASYRHPEWESYPPRTLFSRPPSDMEQRAKEINALDHRGVAGASFFEFDGTIGILASGGGASLVAMDGLLASGLTPANYTEYSGNPPREKVKALAALVLSKPGLEGLWVVGGNANFTDIFETLSGVMDAIEEAVLPKGFPIVIRRGGPRWQEAQESLEVRAQKLSVDLQFFGPDTPLLESVEIMVNAVTKYRSPQEKAE